MPLNLRVKETSKANRQNPGKDATGKIWLE
jgi:hypothetical protein